MTRIHAASPRTAPGVNKVKYFLSGVMAAGWFCLAIAVFVQSISTTSVPVVSTGVLARADGRQGECLTAVEGKAGHDWLDQMQLCMTQAASRLLETGNRSEDRGTAARRLRQ
jgi:hypothetical protein